MERATDSFTTEQIANTFAGMIRSIVADAVKASAPAKREQRLMSTLEAARYLGVSRRTVQEMAANDEFPVTRIGTRVLIDILDLDRWIDANKTKSA
jgi:excisionase family DNA binding protein